MKANKFLKVMSIMGLLLFAGGYTLYSQEMKDYDGNLYKPARLGPQVWTASNLNVTHFRNGEEIPQASSPEEWVKAANEGTPAWCYFENDPENGSKFGKLYNWYAINDSRGLAPEGWHVPQNADWKTLVQNLTGIKVAGGRLKSKTGWKTGNGSDNIGFAALPSGYRDSEGNFADIGITGRWWSNSVPREVKPSPLIYSFVISNKIDEVKYIPQKKGTGHSVRCVKD